MVLVGLRAALPAAGQELGLRVSGASAQRTESVAGSADLNTRLTTIGPRITIVRAVAARQATLSYPREVVKDTIPPKLNGPVEVKRRGLAEALYYRVSGADRSGNAFAAVEGQLQTGTQVFLPAVRR